MVIGKEIFGGTGRNFLNPALTARCFLYFAYSAHLTGDRIWIAAKYHTEEGKIDGYSGATPLGHLAAVDPGQYPTAMESLSDIPTTGGQVSVTWMDAFLGTIPGSIGVKRVLSVA